MKRNNERKNTSSNSTWIKRQLYIFIHVNETFCHLSIAAGNEWHLHLDSNEYRSKPNLFAIPRSYSLFSKQEMAKWNTSKEKKIIILTKFWGQFNKIERQFFCSFFHLKMRKKNSLIEWFSDYLLELPLDTQFHRFRLSI